MQDEELIKVCINHWVFDNNRNLIQYEIKLNDKGDLLLKINRKKDLEKRDTSEIETVYFFNANFKINKYSQESSDQEFLKQCKNDYHRFDKEENSGQSLMIINANKQFQINEDKFFIWDNHVIEYYHLKKALIEENKVQVDLKISLQEKFSFIKNVLIGSQPDMIAIVVEQMQCSHVIQWILSENVEATAFEVDKNHKIIQDRNGDFLILTNSETILPFKNCKLKCYLIDNFDDIQKDQGLPYSQGHRFDSCNHNWIIMKQYICLSFSYMTFVVKNQIEGIEVKDMSQEPLFDKAFDPEAFNYLLNKESCFTEGKLAQQSFLKLQQVLLKLNQIDPVYLDILHYTREWKNLDDESEENIFQAIDVMGVMEKKSLIETHSALHRAFKNGNNRVIDTIMLYMSQISTDNSGAFRSILHELTDAENFAQYLENLPMQTFQMLDKKVLRVKKPLNDSIVGLATSSTAYIDNDFYTKNFGEKPDYKAFPVNIFCMRIDWVIDTQEGKEFLQAILNSERLEYYEIKGLQIIIEFLYKKSKDLLLKYLLPLYLLQGCYFFIAIILQEFRNQHSRGMQIPFVNISENFLHRMTKFVIICNLIWTLVMVLIMAKVIQLTGSSFFKRVYTWFDIIFYSFNTVASFEALKENGLETIEYQRNLQAFAILFFLAKNFYFMKLVDQIAPLIDIIIQVFFDIKWFLFVFMAFIFSFGLAFYLIGNNQVEFDDLSEDDIDNIPYQTIPSSILFMWDVCVGDGGSDSFELGKGTQEKFLKVLYIAAQFIMLIHLLNMLIAIMGNTFGNRNEVAEQIKTRDHLSFVIDNWYLKDYSLGNIKQINYIIAAFHHVGNDSGSHILDKLEDSFDSLKNQIQRDHEEVTKRQRLQEQNMKNSENTKRQQHQQFEEENEEIKKEIKKQGQQIKEQGEMIRQILQLLKK